ncbi:MAG: ATP-binding protein [Sphaerochaetaceae bacterium]|nr:ATP-binding protein [Sphaerochaetaceae bacterium]MDC7250973.1 ATP-binding protein [Sphaerochaetaceae bacterium]
MNYINRPKYIEKIKLFIDKPIIKVITGMRRVGKSTLLTIIKDQILNKVKDINKIYLNFESIELININNDKALINYLEPLLNRLDGKIYFFFDEIQIVKNWEKVINGLRVDYDCDIYITGSNSTLISGDLASLLSGRYVEFEIQPFTFTEFTQVYKALNLPKEILFNKYIKLGGMPFLKYFSLEEIPSSKYLNDVFNTVLVKDVLQYNNIRDVDMFNRIISYVIENIGHTFSANSIKKYFKSEDRKVSVDTVLNYLDFCKKAYIIKKVSRFDTLGKKILKVDEKYYLSDHGFREARGYSNVRDIERTLENIVYIELISRGYEVTIGKVNDKEIDFIAKINNEINYFQVSYLLSDEKTRNREFGSLLEINDNFPKYVLSLDNFNFSQNGIIHKNLINFLLST